MGSKTAIVDYGSGNLNSVRKAVERLDSDPLVTSTAKDILAAEKIILPGVGHFSQAMFNLRKLNLLGALNEAVTVKQKPVLGICLGMELMTTASQEGNVEGLGWLNARTIKFNLSDKTKYQSPHIGWNQIRIRNSGALLKDIPNGSEFYFLHSYHLALENPSDVISETEYDYLFPSTIERENIFGVQYHPEKSHEVGMKLLGNFLKM
jgi:glutamine amidotransferase